MPIEQVSEIPAGWTEKIVPGTCSHVVYTTQSAPGAWPNDTRVRKATFEPGDHHPIGMLGTVLGSLHAPPMGEEFGYFVEWDVMPDVPVFVRGAKLEKLP